MLPIRDVIPTRTTPFVVLALIALNAAALGYAVLFQRPTAGLVVYLLVNILFIWLFGENVEDRTGHDRFVAFYVVCGAVTAIVQVMMATGIHALIAGAGGATAGVMGAYVLLYPRSRIVTLIPLVTWVPVIEVPAMYLVVVWFVLQWSAGTLGSHLAGFATGMSGVVLLRRPERLRVEWWHDLYRAGSLSRSSRSSARS